MSPGQEPELGQEALSILAALFAAEPRDEVSETGPDALAQYVLGSIDSKREDAVLAELVASRNLRERMISMRSELASGRVKDPALSRAIADTVFRAVSDAAEASVRDWRAAVRRPWDRLVAGVWQEIGRRISVAGASGFALARGEEWVPVWGTSVRANLSASVSGGSATVLARFDRDVASGTRIGIDLYDPILGSLPLGEASFEGREWRFVAPGLGAALGVDEGDMPTGMLRLGAGTGDSRVESPEWMIEHADGSWDALRVLILERPRCEAGRFRARVGLPAAIGGDGGGYELVLWLLVEPKRIPFGRQPALDFFRSGELSCALDAPDGPIPYEAVELTLDRSG